MKKVMIGMGEESIWSYIIGWKERRKWINEGD